MDEAFFWKVNELVNDATGKLVVVNTYYFCCESCMDAFLMPIENLWSVSSPAVGEDKGRVCNHCKGPLLPERK